MKKTLIIIVSLLMITAITVKAQNAIPFFNGSIYGSTIFQESKSSPSSLKVMYAKRDMNIQNSGGNYSPGGSPVTAVIYRLDWTKSLGPYTIQNGQTLKVPIDGKEWGVCLNPTVTTTVSVWTSGN